MGLFGSLWSLGIQTLRAYLSLAFLIPPLIFFWMGFIISNIYMVVSFLYLVSTHILLWWVSVQHTFPCQTTGPQRKIWSVLNSQKLWVCNFLIRKKLPSLLYLLFHCNWFCFSKRDKHSGFCFQDCVIWFLKTFHFLSIWHLMSCVVGAQRQSFPFTYRHFSQHVYFISDSSPH